MITYTRIDDKTVKKTTSVDELIDTSKIEDRLAEVKKSLKELKKEPDKVLEPNLRKFEQIRILEAEQQEIEKSLEVLNS